MLYTKNALGHEKRTDAFVRRHIPLLDRVMKRNDHKDAAKGLILSSPMQSLHYFNLVDGFPFDYMHATLMGVVKRVTELLFESTQDMPYTISGRGTLYLQLINSINRSIDRSINQSINQSIHPLLTNHPFLSYTKKGTLLIVVGTSSVCHLVQWN